METEPGRKKLERHGHVLVYLFIGSIVMWGLLSPGYVLTLDMIFGPETSSNFIQHVYGVDKTGKDLSPVPLATFLYFALVRLLDFFLPVWLIQKALLLFILLLSGISMHRLVPAKSHYARYFAGFLYMVNPFVYIRFLAGHYYLLWGYALLPFVIGSFIDLFKEQSRRNIARVGLITSLIIPQTHFVPMILGIFILFLLFNLKKENIGAMAKTSALVLGIFLILNLSWFSSVILEDANVEETLAQIGPDHLALFTSSPSPDFNVVFNVAAMYGFWRGGYELPQENIPGWYLLFFFILFLAVHGFLLGKGDKKLGRYVKALGIVSVISLILATGITHEYFSRVFYFLYERLPFFAGFREPQKFVALVVFTYAYLGGIAVDDFASKMRSRRIYALLILLALAVPFAYTYTMFFGFGGQLKSIDYPGDYYAVNELLNSDEDEFSVLFLPWHGYMDFKWLKNRDKRIANPASVFFNRPIIQGDTIETGGIYSQSTYPVSKYVEFLLASKNEIQNFGELVAPLNVKYVILAKEVDYEKYSFLFDQSDLELMKDTPNLYLFKNRREVAKIYEVDEVSKIEDWDVTSIAEHSEKRILKYEKKSPVKYVLKEKPVKRYVVFAAPYSEDWNMGGKKPIKNLGITNAYEVEGIDSTSIENTSFKFYLIGYIISIILFVILIREAIRHG